MINDEEIKLYYKRAELRDGSVSANYQVGSIYHRNFEEAKQNQTWWSIILWNTSEYQKQQAINYYKKAAEHNHKAAQNTLGLLYYEDKQYKESIYWYQKLVFEQGEIASNFFEESSKAYLNIRFIAEQEYKDDYYKEENEVIKQAAYIFGKLYYDGKLFYPDNAKALNFLAKAAQRNHPEALNIMGDIYYVGKGVTQNYTKAAHYFRCAVEDGCSDAVKSYYDYAYVCHNGLGVGKNIDKAIELYKQAALRGSVNANYNLGQIYNNKFQETEKNPTLWNLLWDTVKSQKLLAINYYKKAAECNHKDAQNALGLLYYNDKEYTEAFTYFKKAAELRLPIAMYYIALMYDHGLGIDKDNQLAFDWYNKAALLKCSEAMYILSKKYMQGDGIDRSIFQAFVWNCKAAESNHLEAKKYLEDREHVFYSITNVIGSNIIKAEQYVEIEKRLGYSFKDPQYIIDSLNRNIKPNKDTVYKYLEFQGDKILSFVISSYLCKHLPNATVEDVHRIHEEMVKNSTILPKIAKELCVEQLLILDTSEKKHQVTDNMLADSIEALIGAIFKDSDNYTLTEKCIIKLWKSDLEQSLKIVKRRLSGIKPDIYFSNSHKLGISSPGETDDIKEKLQLIVTPKRAASRPRF